ncbi:PRC-barrel domain-containing protein [Microvirga lenta]|uniref:PRC-barrel domain-containing protein n=1 Tax=Microvirga lenta TaxID=2881337 RepID=UPI001CFFE28D|nr:PRC-barrel domain-containing protein [Microvirga lenta]MCB5177538.1 PRC-barrel domain-containing protein [Microvirga lenta]
MKLFVTILASTALTSAVALAQSQPTAQQPGLAQDGSQATQQSSAQNRPIPASELRGKEVVNDRGDTVGRVERVMIGQNDQAFAVVRFEGEVGLGDEPRMIPVDRLDMQDDRLVLAGAAAELNQTEEYRENLSGYREAGGNQQVALGQQGRRSGQDRQQNDRTQVVVRQSQPQVQVEQAQPQVRVQQPQPNVTVRQPQPQIIVRQAPPTITVDQPQPEIIVRMPEPDVNVAMAQPQVEVNQPQPQVRVVQPERQQQSAATVEQAQPQVQVLPPQEEANVNLQRAEQPQVSYERTGEPRVEFNEAQGQPTIRYERMGENQQGQQQAQQRQAQATQQGQQQSQATAGYSEEQRRSLRERLNAGDVESTGSVDANVQVRPVAISDLENAEVYNGRGDELGKVDRVIQTPQGGQYLVVGSGGFLGIGRDRVAFPIDRFWLRGDRLVIRGVTEEDIEAMDDYRDTLDSFQRAGRTDRADLRVWQ